MRYRTLLALSSVLDFCLAEKPFETWVEAISRQWKPLRPADKDVEMQMYIAISNPKDGEFEEHALQIATPGSPHYRQHLSADEMSLWMQPPRDSVRRIQDWLKTNNIDSFLDHDILVASGVVVSQAETLLQTNYTIFREKDTGEQTIRTDKYFIPESLRDDIEFISPTVHFPVMKRIRRSSKLRRRHLQDREKETISTEVEEAVKKACKPGVKSNQGPACLRALYEVDSYTATNPKTAFGIHAPSTGYDQSFLMAYFKKFNPAAYRARAAFDIIAPVNNTVRGFRKTDEANLDTQISYGLAYPAKAYYYLNTNHGSFDPQKFDKGTPGYRKALRIEDEFFIFLHGLVYNKTGASVVSESDGSNEQLVSRSIARRYCRMFAQIGARGITYLWATGDNGAQGYQDGVPRSTVMAPTFPGSCPWVTGVGATANVFNESAATFRTSVFASSGGFSNYFSRPAYQDAAVSKYIQKHITPLRTRYEKLSGFNITGRAIPDISAIGFHSAYIDNSKHIVQNADGTSASSPAWAAFVALLNDHEFNRGCPPLGFLNPWLYSLKPGQGIKDIIYGGPNEGLNGYYPDPPVPSDAPNLGGYVTGEGYDPVTGLGSLTFKDLIKNIPTC